MAEKIASMPALYQNAGTIQCVFSTPDHERLVATTEVRSVPCRYVSRARESRAWTHDYGREVDLASFVFKPCFGRLCGDSLASDYLDGIVRCHPGESEAAG
jgi:hypothetical protein